MWNPLRMGYGQWICGTKFKENCWIVSNGIKVNVLNRYKTKKQAIAVCERLNQTRSMLDSMEKI